MSEKAYIVHCFSRFHQNRCHIYLIGRLENGETFGLLEKNFIPFFYIRLSDRQRAESTIKKHGLCFKTSPRSSMDDEEMLLLRHADKGRLRTVAKALEQLGIRTYEADVKTELQYLSALNLRRSCTITGSWRKGKTVDRFYTQAQLETSTISLNPLSVVLETYFKDKTLKAFAIAEVTSRQEDLPKTLAHEESSDEAQLLLSLRQHLRQIDPDVIASWDAQDSVFLKLKKRFHDHGLAFDLGRSREGAWFIEREYRGRELAIVQGRQILDIEALMDHTWERYSESTPESIIAAVLNEEVPSEEHCSQRSLLLSRLLRKKNLIDLSMRRSLLTGLSLERCWGSIASFEYLYMQELHKQNYLAPSLGVDRILNGSSPGGLVMAPSAGFHKNIFVFDFKSLYPSIIRTFNIDPLAYARALEEPLSHEQIELPNGTRFDRRAGILPAILERFFASREQAKGSHDELASFVCKILMNSFFGVLGTSGCRFAQGPLVAAVSQTGHYLLRWMRSLLEDEGFEVLYGDTDSLFVDLGIRQELSFQEAMTKGQEVQEFLNETLRQHLKKTFSIDSHLDLEFEKFYRNFFQPSMRGKEGQGRAKSYAALKATKDGDVLEIVGLEAVRRDWTDLAQELQRQILTMIFSRQEGVKIEEYVQQIIKDLKTGLLDKKLIYRKRLTKPLESYTKTTPPHVKAARMLDDVPRVIFYVMTTAGPEPVSQQTRSLDYQHYIDKQIEPIVETLALHYDFSADKAINTQGRLWY